MLISTKELVAPNRLTRFITKKFSTFGMIYFGQNLIGNFAANSTRHTHPLLGPQPLTIHGAILSETLFEKKGFYLKQFRAKTAINEGHEISLKTSVFLLDNGGPKNDSCSTTKQDFLSYYSPDLGQCDELPTI